MTDGLDLDAIRNDWKCEEHAIPVGACSTTQIVLRSAWQTIEPLLAEVERLRREVDMSNGYAADSARLYVCTGQEMHKLRTTNAARDNEIERLTSMLSEIHAEHERAVQHARNLQTQLDSAVGVIARIVRSYL